MAEWTDGWWWSADGIRLHYRDYPGGPPDRPPILCVPGLTRNARDFAATAERLAGAWRLICVDLRGRGESGHARDPMSYAPPVYVQDLEALVAELKLGRFVMFGTSLGGILTMLMASLERGRVAGAMINDIGPIIEAAGLDRIRGYVGKGGSWPTWAHAARAIAELHGMAHPRFGLAEWIAMAKRTCRLTKAGRIVPDYDMRIADALRAPDEGPGFDLWPALEALGGVPTLLLRGATSDLLSAATAAEMARRVPALELVEVPDAGHAPTLDEPEAVAGIDRLLARIVAEPRPA